jgi:hypothetical protein
LTSKALAAAPDVSLFLYYRALAYWDDGHNETAALADLARITDQTPEMHILADQDSSLAQASGRGGSRATPVAGAG